MNADRIVIRRTDTNFGYYTVEAEGKMSAYLCWGEMVEMLIHLTHPDIKGPRYHWRTVEEEIAEDERRKTAVAKSNTPAETLHDIQPIASRVPTYSCDVCHGISTSPICNGICEDCSNIPF